MSGVFGSADDVAVVVVGAELNGLGVVRSIAREKLVVLAVDTRFTGAGLWSRHARGHLIRSYTGRHFVEDMIALGRRFHNPPVLILTNEDAVHSVSENRQELSRWFRFRLPADETVKLLSSKASFHDFSSRFGFPVPRSVILEGKPDLGLLSSLRYPCVLKPVDRRDALRGEKPRALRVDSLSEAHAAANVMLATPGAVVAQEWIEGPDSNIYFTLFYRGAAGVVAAIFTGRKLRSSPPRVGNTAICIAAPEVRAQLEPLTLSFAERVGFVGMGSMEYKWDDVHKQFLMVEPTVGRTDLQEEVATLSGVNLPLAAYRYEMGLPPQPAESGRPPVAWRATFLDGALPEFVDAGVKTVDGYFRWTDPMPAFEHYCLLGPLRRVKRWWRTGTPEGWQARKA